MKKTSLILFVFGLLFSFNTQAQDRQLSQQETPKEIKAYVAENFSNHKIVSVEEEKKYVGLEYEVELDDDTTIEFDQAFTVTKIDTEHKPLPANLVPDNIKSYVSKHYPNMHITSWEKKRKGEKVELNDDLELYFDDSGRFKRMDR